MSTQTARYTAVAVVLHWAIAVAVLFMIPFGFIMHERAEHGDASQVIFQAYQLHKSIGLTVLALTLVRLAWRLTHRPPPLPAGMPAWEAFAARATHWAFYALTLALPLTGWLYVSAGWSIHTDEALSIPTRWFGFFQVPHLFGLAHASNEVRADTAQAAMVAHAYLAFGAIGLVTLHVAAALKHQFINRDETLEHMVPGVRAPGAEPSPRNAARSAFIGAGLAAIALALFASLYAVAGLATPPQEASHFEVAEEDDAAPPAAPETSTLAPTETPAAPAVPGAPSAWTVDRGQSSIGFSYAYEDDNGSTQFNGRFSSWRADLRFDPANLDASTIVVRIQTGSASTGVAVHDSALPTANWFNTSAFPTAEFRSTRIRARGEGQYEARGTLTIKGQAHTVDLPFTLAVNGDHATVSGSTEIDRRDFGIGTGDDGDDLISRNIAIAIRVDATRAP